MDEGRLDKLRSFLFAPWWVRYLLLPAVAAAPGMALAFWFGIHRENENDYWLKGWDQWTIAGAMVWAGAVTAIKSGANDVTATVVKALRKDRDDLLRLIALIRLVVGYKSRRFHEAASRLIGESHERIFKEITQPELQIRQIVQAIFGFYNEQPGQERITISLMRWDSINQHLVFVEHYPDADYPKANVRQFNDRNTLAGRAFFEACLVISEDTARDPRYQKMGDGGHDGSMFSYPVQDPYETSPVFVINVVSTRIGRFLEKNAESIRVIMEVFSERLILENQLLSLKGKEGPK